MVSFAAADRRLAGAEVAEVFRVMALVLMVRGDSVRHPTAHGYRRKEIALRRGDRRDLSETMEVVPT